MPEARSARGTSNPTRCYTAAKLLGSACSYSTRCSALETEQAVAPAEDCGEQDSEKDDSDEEVPSADGREAEQVLDCIEHFGGDESDHEEYLIKFKGYAQAEWTPAAKMVGCKKLIWQFYADMEGITVGGGLLAWRSIARRPEQAHAECISCMGFGTLLHAPSLETALQAVRRLH